MCSSDLGIFRGRVGASPRTYAAARLLLRSNSQVLDLFARLIEPEEPVIATFLAIPSVCEPSMSIFSTRIGFSSKSPPLVGRWRFSSITATFCYGIRCIVSSARWRLDCRRSFRAGDSTQQHAFGLLLWVVLELRRTISFSGS